MQEAAHTSFIEKDHFTFYADAVAGIVTRELPAWLRVRALEHAAARLRATHESLGQRLTELDQVLAAASEIDADATKAFRKKAIERSWGTVKSVSQQRSPVVSLIELEGACERLYASWYEGAGSKTVLDIVEIWAERKPSVRRAPGEEYKAWLLRALAQFALEVGNGVTFQPTLLKCFDDPEVETALAFAGNQTSLGKTLHPPTVNRAFVLTTDDELAEKVRSALRRLQSPPLAPADVQQLGSDLRFRGQRAVAVVYFHTGDTILNLPELRESKAAYVRHAQRRDEEPADLFHLDARFLTRRPPMPEIELEAANAIECWHCQTNLQPFFAHRDSVFECPNCGVPVRNWCGRKDCEAVIRDVSSEGPRECPGCNQPRLPLYFSCDRHGRRMWFSKHDDLCSRCVAEGVPNPTGARPAASLTECMGCVRHGIAVPAKFLGRVLQIIDGIDSDQEERDAEAYFSDHRSFSAGECLKCGTLMLPVCPYGTPDPGFSEPHFVRREAVPGSSEKRSLCLRRHVDAEGRAVKTSDVYTCGTCEMPLRRPDGGEVTCPRCGAQNFPCAFTTRKGSRRRGTAERLTGSRCCRPRRRPRPPAPCAGSACSRSGPRRPPATEARPSLRRLRSSC
jgi:hypothetical protein